MLKSGRKLRSRIKLILDLPKCVIIIDDFKHPFKEFNYDSYTVDGMVIPNDLDNIRDLLKSDNFSQHHGDLLDLISLENIIKKVKC